jgi:hypothetical protein
MASPSQPQEPVFSGIIPNGTEFDSTQSLPVYPNATLAGAEGPMNLTGYAAFLPGYPDTFCNLSMPNGEILPFNSSLARAFNYSFSQASSLTDFAKNIYLNCQGAAAALRLTGAVYADGQYSQTLVSIVNFTGSAIKTGLSFFKSMLRGSTEASYCNSL